MPDLGILVLPLGVAPPLEPDPEVRLGAHRDDLGLGRRAPAEPFVLVAVGPFEGAGLRVSLALLGRHVYPFLADRSLPEGWEVLGLSEDISAATLQDLGRRMATRLGIDLVDLCGSAPRRITPEDQLWAGRKRLPELLGIDGPDLDATSRTPGPMVASLPLLHARNRTFRTLDRALAVAIPVALLLTCLASAALALPGYSAWATTLLPALLVLTLAGLTARSILANARAEVRVRADASRILVEEAWGEHRLGSLEISTPSLIQMIEGQGQLRLVLPKREILIPVGDPLALRRSLEAALFADLGLVPPGGLFRDLFWFAAGEASAEPGLKKPAPGRLCLRWKGRRLDLSARRERALPGLGRIDPSLALPGEEGVVSSVVLHGTRLAGGRSFQIRLCEPGSTGSPGDTRSQEPIGQPLGAGVRLSLPEGETDSDLPGWTEALPVADLERLAADLPGALIDVNPMRAALFHPGLQVSDRALRTALSVLDGLLSRTAPGPDAESTQDPIRIEALTPGTARCGFCADEVPEAEAVPCPRCEAPHHRECWDQNDGCTVFGCASPATPSPDRSVDPDHGG